MLYGCSRPRKYLIRSLARRYAWIVSAIILHGHLDLVIVVVQTDNCRYCVGFEVTRYLNIITSRESLKPNYDDL